ncbi:ATP-binding cassette domain-containing protein [Streptomyces albidoflavus]|uniref:ATP-binding cassette domain-containing protein n=1 Tax=Streptomyces albidoflavus TaxID=1886 RepID=UPI003159B8E5
MRAHTSPVLVADNLCFAYPGERGGIRSASLALSASVTASVRGPSGSGKSTLLALLGLILTPASGTLSLAGTDTRRLSRRERDRLRRQRIGVVLQDVGLLPYLNAWENVATAFGPRLGAHRKEARGLVERLGMGELADAPVTTLSGGERRRIAVARAAVKQPAVILADEPTAGLDPAAAKLVLDALGAQAARGAAVLLVTHDPAVAECCAEQYVVERGSLTRQATDDQSVAPAPRPEQMASEEAQR